MGPIRFIFPAFVLGMWVVCGMGLANGQWLGIHWLMLGLAHLACAIIFANFVYVFSYGYGVSMVLANLGVMAWRPAPAALLVGGLGLAYGLRLRVVRLRALSKPGLCQPAGPGRAGQCGRAGAAAPVHVDFLRLADGLPGHASLGRGGVWQDSPPGSSPEPG